MRFTIKQLVTQSLKEKQNNSRKIKSTSLTTLISQGSLRNEQIQQKFLIFRPLSETKARFYPNK